MRSSVNTGLERNVTRSISSGLVNRLGQSSSAWSDIYSFCDAHLLPAGVGFAAITVAHGLIVNIQSRQHSGHPSTKAQADPTTGFR